MPLPTKNPIRTSLMALAIAAMAVVLALAAGQTHADTQATTETEECARGTTVDPDASDAMLADCNTLLRLRDDIRGTGELNWSADRYITQWTGVFVPNYTSEQYANGAERRVTELATWGSDLNGVLPSGLSNLTALERLTVNDTQISGSIPAELGALTTLGKLEIADNPRITGNIPPELGNLTNLTSLDLVGNALTGDIPAALFGAGETPGTLKLEEINLGDNLLTGSIPAEIANLAALERVDFSNVPIEEGNSGQNRNQLTGAVPEALINLSGLEELWLAGNQLTGCVPQSRDSLSHDLAVCGDKHTLLEIKAALGNPAKLESWKDGSDEWTGVIFDDDGNVIEINLNNMKMAKGQKDMLMPEQFGTLSQLAVLKLNNNRFKGSLPDSLGNLSNLRELKLANNRFTGNLPASFSNLKKLQQLNLNGNSFDGEFEDILASVPDMESLKVLKIKDNQTLQTDRSEDLDMLKDLRDLGEMKVAGSDFNIGCIPKWIADQGDTFDHDFHEAGINFNCTR